MAMTDPRSVSSLLHSVRPRELRSPRIGRIDWETGFLDFEDGLVFDQGVLSSRRPDTQGEGGHTVDLKRGTRESTGEFLVFVDAGSNARTQYFTAKKVIEVLGSESLSRILARFKNAENVTLRVLGELNAHRLAGSFRATGARAWCVSTAVPTRRG